MLNRVSPGAGRMFLVASWRVQRIITAFLLFAALTNIVWFIYQAETSEPNVVVTGTSTIIFEPNHTISLRKIRIAMALLVCAIAIWWRSGKGLIVVLPALLWVVMEYVFWWRSSYLMVKHSESPNFSTIDHIAFLYSATWWDIWILVVVVVCLALELYMLSTVSSRKDYL